MKQSTTTSLAKFCTLTCYTFSPSVSLKRISGGVYDILIVGYDRSFAANRTL